MPRVYMIRHGKPASTWNDDAGADPGLDEMGARQALSACEALMALPIGSRPIRVLTSPLRRCRETAAPLAEILGVEAVLEPLVAEIPTPKTLSNDARIPWLHAAFQTTWDEVEGDIDYGAWRDQVARTVAACGLGQGACAVFSHFVAINAAVSAATGDARVMSFQPDHASITVFDTDGFSLTLVERGRAMATAVL